MASTADDVEMRTFLPTLSAVVQSGINVIVWAGDTDWICNWLASYEVANAVKYSGQAKFKAKALAPYTVNGVEKGVFKNVDNFSFLKVYGAGHEVPYYRESSPLPLLLNMAMLMCPVEPEASLQVFVQTIQKKPIFST
jgi:carboxypeptidase C (cathepsin A)